MVSTTSPSMQSLSEAPDLSASKQKLKDLLAQRDAMEAEAAAISARLNAPGQPGIVGGLLDKEGYPRADIDVAAIRGDRHRLACLNTDHKQLSAQIEGLLAQVHEAARVQREVSPTPAPVPAQPSSTSVAPGTLSAGPAGMDVDAAGLGQAGTSGSTDVAMEEQGGLRFNGGAALRAFAVVDEVAEGSPAAAAGVQVGDRVCSFGDVRAGEQGLGGELQRIAQVLSISEGREVVMAVLRHGQPLSLAVTPQTWAGRGLLGCHLQPLKP